MKSARYLVLFLCFFLFSCMRPHCTFKLTVSETVEGRNVFLVDLDFINTLPGKPFDKCIVLSQMFLSYKDDLCILTASDWDIALRNETASLSGNVVIPTHYNSVMYHYPQQSSFSGARG